MQLASWGPWGRWGQPSPCDQLGPMRILVVAPRSFLLFLVRQSPHRAPSKCLPVSKLYAHNNKTHNNALPPAHLSLFSYFLTVNKRDIDTLRTYTHTEAVLFTVVNACPVPLWRAFSWLRCWRT